MKRPVRKSLMRRMLARLAAALGTRRQPAVPTPHRPPARTSHDQPDLAVRQVLAVLKQVLDRHPKARTVFGHLALLEQGLRHLGVEMLKRMTPHSLQRARDQLASVASEEETRPLVELLERAGVAPRAAEVPAAAHDFGDSRFSPEVTEADPTVYFQVMRAWQDTLVEEEQAQQQAEGDDMPPGWLHTVPMPTNLLA